MHFIDPALLKVHQLTPLSTDRSCGLIHRGGKGLEIQFWKMYWQSSKQKQAGMRGDADPDGLLVTEDKRTVFGKFTLDANVADVEHGI